MQGKFPLRVEQLRNSRLKKSVTPYGAVRIADDFTPWGAIQRSGSVRLTFANISLKYNPFPKWRQ